MSNLTILLLTIVIFDSRKLPRAQSYRLHLNAPKEKLHHSHLHFQRQKYLCSWGLESPSALLQLQDRDLDIWCPEPSFDLLCMTWQVFGGPDRSWWSQWRSPDWGKKLGSPEICVSGRCRLPSKAEINTKDPVALKGCFLKINILLRLFLRFPSLGNIIWGLLWQKFRLFGEFV